jgi:hypothetical protein
LALSLADWRIEAASLFAQHAATICESCPSSFDIATAFPFAQNRQLHAGAVQRSAGRGQQRGKCSPVEDRVQ